jgi:hypothetical protein
MDPLTAVIPDMVRIPAGTFLMGTPDEDSAEDGDDDERSLHRVDTGSRIRKKASANLGAIQPDTGPRAVTLVPIQEKR